MARVMVEDTWLKNDGDVPPSASAKRSLANAKDPQKANVPARWRSYRYGRGMRWRCRWYVSDDDGHKRQRAKMFAKLSEAEEFRTAMDDDIRRGRYLDPNAGNRRFRDVAEAWMKTKVGNRASTNNRYRDELRVYVYPQWGDFHLREITRQRMSDWVAELIEGTYSAELPNNRKPIPLSARSIRNVVKVVTAGALGYAVEQRWISENVARDVETPRIIQSDDDKVYLTIGEVEDLADSAAKLGSAMDGTLVRFLAFTGVRVNEALALQVRDIRFDDRRARISRTWTEDAHRGMKLGVPKSGAGRTVAIPRFIMPELQTLCDGQPDTAFVFRSARGGHVFDHNWRSRIWAHAVRNAGLEGIQGLRIHSLRHTYASIAIANGADVKTLQAQLGHASATETLDTYSALWPERLGEVADAVDNARSSVIVPNRASNADAEVMKNPRNLNDSKG